MILGIVRHFKVLMPERKILYSPSEFRESLEIYDAAPVSKKEVAFQDWEICFSSNLPRAVKTAKTVFNGRIVFSDLIREVPMEPFTEKKILLPSFIWHIGARIAWFNNRNSQPETRKKTLENINSFIDILRSSGKSKNLIVTHGFFMRVFTEQLVKRGFSGKVDDRPRNGKLYIFSET